MTEVPPSDADAAAFLGVEPTENPRRFTMQVGPGNISGIGALFGGCGLAAGVVALETVCDRPLVWATAQYLAFARPPQWLEIDCSEFERGHTVSQARAVIHERESGAEILTVTAALGQRTSPYAATFATMPQMPDPQDCPPRPQLPHMADTIAARLDARLANARVWEELDGTPRPDGRSALWVRTPELDTSQRTGAAYLAILGDYLPFGMSQALGVPVMANSLDNTLRMVSTAASEWVLLDIEAHAVLDGFSSGIVRMWSQDGTLLATGSQSCVVRSPR